MFLGRDGGRKAGREGERGQAKKNMQQRSYIAHNTPKILTLWVISRKAVDLCAENKMAAMSTTAI